MDSAAAEPLTIEVVPGDDGTTVIRVGGELDVHTAPTLSSAVADAFEGGATSIDIDAGGLQFCDSSGIQVLVQAREQALAEGGSVRVTNARGPVEKVLTVTGLLELFS
jgi:anti-sigma B factor antagonist